MFNRGSAPNTLSDAIVPIGTPPRFGEILSKIANVTRNSSGAAIKIHVYISE